MALSPRSQQALLSLPAFRGLGEAERKQVAERVREIALEKGEIVYHAGDDADALYLVVAGAVDVLDGERVMRRRLGVRANRCPRCAGARADSHRRSRRRQHGGDRRGPLRPRVHSRAAGGDRHQRP